MSCTRHAASQVACTSLRTSRARPASSGSLGASRHPGSGAGVRIEGTSAGSRPMCTSMETGLC
eukprot:3107846-Lingulodinium_polyedra.AAC.1